MAVNIQRLDDVEDLRLLIRGDAIPREDSFALDPWKRHIVAYHRTNDAGHLEFVFLSPAGNCIIMDRVRKSHIQVVKGMMIYNRDRCATESFSQSDSRYPDLTKTLQMAGLK